MTAGLKLGPSSGNQAKVAQLCGQPQHPSPRLQGFLRQATDFGFGINSSAIDNSRLKNITSPPK